MPTTVPGTGTSKRAATQSNSIPSIRPQHNSSFELDLPVTPTSRQFTPRMDAARPRTYDPQVGFDIPAAVDQLGYRVAKRAMDLVLGSVAIVLLAPFMLVAALAVKWQDGGPIFFAQRRVGRGGRLFTCLKFRTMVVNADAIKHTVLDLNHHQDHRTFKVKRDPRVTRCGLWLRRLSIDEFPQLLNVLRGEMTLVGPRPPVPGEVALYTDFDLRRLEVKPGLTCLWQIGGRGDLPFDQQIVLDLEYIEKRSFLFDLALLFRTVPVLLTAKGAY